MKKLKSSLKLSRHDSLSPSITSSTSSISSASSTSFSSNPSSSNTYKFVRFAPQLTTIKSFHINDEPISISNETSPVLYPIDNISPFTSATETTPANKMSKQNLWDFNFDDIEDDFDLDYFDNYHLTYTNAPTGVIPAISAANTVTDANTLLTFNNIIESPTFNMTNFYNNDIQACIISSNFDNKNNDYYHLDPYDNIKVINISLVKDNVIRGTIKVRNLQYEKFIQCKFTFDNWKQIHYIKADYSYSPTNYEDIFIFDIDLNAWKFFLEYHKLIDNVMINNQNNLNLEFVCMYNVNDSVYYDNNNYQNFILNLNVSPKLNNSMATIYNNSNNTDKNNKNINTDKIITTAAATTNNSTIPKNRDKVVTRKFSKDTDYYNESPLKHMFHTDTYWIHPKNQNKLSFFIDDQMQETDYDTLMNKYNNSNNSSGNDNSSVITINNTINDNSMPSLSSSYSDLSSWDTDDSEKEYFFDCYDYDYTFSPALNNTNNITSGTYSSTTNTAAITTSNTIPTDECNNPYKYNNFLAKTNSMDTLLCFDKRWDDRENFYNNENSYLDNEDNETITSINEIGNSNTNIATFDITYDYCNVQL
ncbi:hypothetical protein RI543_001599 [Arxiozyma heterogenica]|uniref:CBM21 domain-containing protein n=1 Tax=Arxiozyma heterogenica TaxID=278026 RepID=A0AAN8A7P1_9SACH|nr:hypothetical protein RI543_001599 [Kazachstania heterogenica]